METEKLPVDPETEPVDLDKVEDPKVLRDIIKKQNDEMAKKRLKAKTAEDLELQLEEYKTKEKERVAKEKEFKDEELRKKGEFEALLTQEKTEKELLRLEHEKAVAELAEYHKLKETEAVKLEAERKALLDELPEDLRVTYADSSKAVIQDRLTAYKTFKGTDNGVNPLNTSKQKEIDQKEMEKLSPFEQIRLKISQISQ
jgi:hypothetical protein